MSFHRNNNKQLSEKLPNGTVIEVAEEIFIDNDEGIPKLKLAKDPNILFLFIIEALHFVIHSPLQVNKLVIEISTEISECTNKFLRNFSKKMLKQFWRKKIPNCSRYLKVISERFFIDNVKEIPNGIVGGLLKE